jgi:hypothetical protein
MTDKTIDLDQHRGMAAQKATDLRRLLADVEANEKALRLRQDFGAKLPRRRATFSIFLPFLWPRKIPADRS